MGPLRIASVILFGGLVLAATPVQAATCDPAPHDQNPIQATPAAFSPVAKAVNRNFSTALGSQRYYDLIDKLDGVTLGFGNWPQQEVGGFFSDMARINNGAAFASLKACLIKRFEVHAAEWRALERAAKMPETQLGDASIATALTRTVLSPIFMVRYARHCLATCKAGEPNFYKEQIDWFRPAMHDAFCDKKVIAWQVDFWSRTIVADAVARATSLGFAQEDEPAVVAIAAYRSSSPAWLNDVLAAAHAGGMIRFNGRVWDWGRPSAGTSRPDALRRWRLLVLWQLYANHVEVAQMKRNRSWSFRDRSQLFYTDYLKDWWVLPAIDQHGRPNWKSEENLKPQLVKPAT